MCDPSTLIALAATVGSTLFGVASMPDPPAPELPAAPAPTARNPGATVRVGTGAEELENTDPGDTGGKPVVRQRASGSALGGLGRSSLAL